MSSVVPRPAIPRRNLKIEKNILQNADMLGSHGQQVERQSGSSVRIYVYFLEVLSVHITELNSALMAAIANRLLETENYP